MTSVDDAYEEYVRLLGVHNVWSEGTNYKKAREALVEFFEGDLGHKVVDDVPSKDWSSKGRARQEGTPFTWLGEDAPFARFFSKAELKRLIDEADKPSSWRVSTLVDLAFYGYKPRTIDVAHPTLTYVLLCWATQVWYDHKTRRKPFGSPEFRVLAGFSYKGPRDLVANFVTEEDVGIYAKLCYVTFSPLNPIALVDRTDRTPVVAGEAMNWNRFLALASDLNTTLNRALATNEIQATLASTWIERTRERYGNDPLSQIDPKDLTTLGESSLASYRNAMVCFKRYWRPTDSISARLASLCVYLLFPGDCYRIEGQEEPLVLVNLQTDASTLYGSVANFLARKRKTDLTRIDFRIRRRSYALRIGDESESILNPELSGPVDEDKDVSTDEDALKLVAWQTLRLIEDPNDSNWTRLEVSESSGTILKIGDKESRAKLGPVDESKRALKIGRATNVFSRVAPKDPTPEIENYRAKLTVMLWYLEMAPSNQEEQKEAVVDEESELASMERFVDDNQKAMLDAIELVRCDQTDVGLRGTDPSRTESAMASLFRVVGTSKDQNLGCLDVVFDVPPEEEEPRAGLLGRITSPFRTVLNTVAYNPRVSAIVAVAIAVGGFAGIPGVSLVNYTLMSYKAFNATTNLVGKAYAWAKKSK